MFSVKDHHMSISSPKHVSEEHLDGSMQHAHTPRGRPSLKRQSTAPAPHSDAAVKRARGSGEFGQQIWSAEVHSAFLEGIVFSFWYNK